MKTVELIEGIILILRDNVSGWSEEDGHPHVYPTHPTTDLDRDEYPRATVDIIANQTADSDIEHKRFIEDVLVDVTVYTIDPKEANRLTGDSKSAVVANHDGTFVNDDGVTEEYLPDWSFSGPGTISPMMEEGVDEGLTRYSRTTEFDFRTINIE